MKFKILRLYEEGEILRVETECKFGKNNIGLSLEKKYMDPITNQPRYIKEIKEILRRKYTKSLIKQNDIKDKFVGKTMDV